MKVVMKFGGTSLADAGRIRQCVDLVREGGKEHKVVTVVSAMGGVTDALLELADAAGAGNRGAAKKLLADLRAKHEEAAREIKAAKEIAPLLDELDRLVAGIEAVGEVTRRSRDAVVSFGERLCSTLMARALGGRAMTGQEVGIVTDDNHGEAEPLMNLSLYQVREALEKPLEAGEHVVVTGFLGATQHGVTTTIGRGGSDYTATILGAALKADEIWIWSDVDGIMTADPRIVPDAKLLETLTFLEAIEMGQFGAKSMHPRALEPAAEHNIPVRMRNTFNPKCPGTRIEKKGAKTPEGAVRAVPLVKKSSLLTVAGAAMIGRPGTAARVFQALAEAQINVRVISQSVSEAGISVVVGRTQLERALAALEANLMRPGIARGVQVEEDVGVVAVVGCNMRGVPGVAARVFGAVAKARVNVIVISQGSSEMSICFVVRGDDGAEAVRALHKEFGLGKGG